jgi:menaquinol-cytochrome c reductase iron-sulfur subunit
MTEEHACSRNAAKTAESHGAQTEDRRLAVKIIAAGVGAVAGLIPAAAGIATFIDPAARREHKFTDRSKPAGQTLEGGYIRVASLADVPTDGRPLRVTVRDDVTNKWTFTPNEPVGEVFLRRTSSSEKPIAFTTVCPHLGCAISLAKGDDGKPIFKCPCHKSSFQIDGKMIQPTPSPRDMDTLECKVENGVVYVKYENFHTGRTDKTPKH